MVILVLEDDRDLRETLTTILEDEGHSVLSAGEGMQAMAMVLDGVSPDVALLDVGLPDISGWEVADVIRQTHPWCRIYMLTGWAKFFDRHTDMVDGIIIKPVSIRDLLGIINGLPH